MQMAVTLMPANHPTDAPATSAQVLSLDEQRLLRQAVPILNDVVRKLWLRLGGNIDRDDLQSMGHMALVRLVRRFDPQKAPLDAFLRRRLHFALLDGIRSESHSRVVVARARAFRAAERMAQAREDERSELNSASSLAALSGTDEIPTEADYRAQLNQMLREQATALGVSLIATRGKETAKADSSSNPEKAIMRAAASNELRKLIATMQDERQLQLIQRHYYGEETLENIAIDLGISKGWASRLHAKAVRYLAKRLRELHAVPEM